MYYKIENEQINPIDINIREEIVPPVIGIFTSKEWENQISRKEEHIRFCKLEVYPDYLFGTFYIPSKNNYQEKICFTYYIIKKNIIFIDDTDTVNTIIKKISSFKLRKGYCIDHFFYDFLETLIEKDLLYIEQIEKKILKIEEAILNNSLEHFNHKMIKLKKEILCFYRYYSQLLDIGQELLENENDFFCKKELSLFKLFIDRVSHLQSETQLLREYAMQVQDVYQSQIDIKQNNVMKILTVITTIFLPLSLIAGWYGMNFSNMPELHSKYGYPLVILASMIIVIICLWIFKKKDFW